MFHQVFLEKSLKTNPRVEILLSKIKFKQLIEIEEYGKYFAQSKKPYLQKRQDLNLYIANKKGQLLKEAPDAYGTYGEPHYYYVHAYNCIYECDYCYLQGYFHSPDLVLFLNHDEILASMKVLMDKSKPLIKSGKKIWFHAGEFSDSLALSHLTQEIETYYDFFKNNPMAMWELRTKSVNTKVIKELEPLENMVTSFSLSPTETARNHDLKTPPTKLRIKAMKELQELGHKVAMHLDPIILNDTFKEQYEELLEYLRNEIDLSKIEYVSLGVVRFSSDVYSQVKKNYPESAYLNKEFITANDGKIKYPKPIRNWMLSTVKQVCLNSGLKEEQLYLCMES
jgi:spore photoproduct lyase